MQKDTKEALARLEKALLEEETPELDDDALDALLEEFLDEEDEPGIAEHPRGYQNFANGYHAYNSDETDEDLDVYSDAVMDEQETTPMLLRIILTAALTGALASLAYVVFRCLL